MSKYQMDDGTVVDTDKAQESWNENTFWDGHNHISTATGSQWNHETLYQSRKGRYYVVHESQLGSRPHAEWVSNHEAARWMSANECDNIPEDLRSFIEEVTE